MTSLLKKENLPTVLLLVAVPIIIAGSFDAYNNGLTIHSIVFLIIGAIVFIVGAFIARRSRES